MAQYREEGKKNKKHKRKLKAHKRRLAKAQSDCDESGAADSREDASNATPGAGLQFGANGNHNKKLKGN
jgi:hypothetical protein